MADEFTPASSQKPTPGKSATVPDGRAEANGLQELKQKPRPGESAAPSPAEAKKAKPPSVAAPAEVKDSFREIVETVVFVVVLVLLLKSFVAEAFVIPTGSMAETLFGYQKMVKCPECDLSFPVNCSDEAERGIPVTGCICPSCRLRIERLRESCSSGDRVLVAKFLWDSKVRDLDRYDVTVFKFPEEPQRQQTPKNYIKRLIGLPDETIGILGGDIHVALGLKYIKISPEEQLLPARRQTHKNDEDARRLLEEGSPAFKILRKPPDKALSLRRLVYDNDHQARDLLKLLPPRWAPEKDEGAASDAPATAYVQKRKRAETEAAWTADASHGFQHPARQAGMDWLRYRHIVPSPVARPAVPEMDRACEPITDVMGYNGGIPERFHYPLQWVGDLILECDVHIDQAEGEVVLELSKGVDRFQAHWQLADGTCTLYRLDADGKKKDLDKTATSLKRSGKYRLRFANVDERLTVWVDGKLVFGDGVSYEPLRKSLGDGKFEVQRGPVDRNDLEPASIGVKGAAVRVHKLKLFRDTYYTNPTGDPKNGTTLYVQPGHYLCLGDNSPYSSDSRTWDHEDRGDGRGGLVPEQLILGRALLVYWPPSRFGPIK